MLKSVQLGGNCDLRWPFVSPVCGVGWCGDEGVVSLKMCQLFVSANSNALMLHFVSETTKKEHSRGLKYTHCQPPPWCIISARKSIKYPLQRCESFLSQLKQKTKPISIVRCCCIGLSANNTPEQVHVVLAGTAFWYVPGNVNRKFDSAQHSTHSLNIYARRLQNSTGTV